MSHLPALLTRPDLPRSRPLAETQADFRTALTALLRLCADARELREVSPKHATLHARYDQAIRLLLADSPDIRVPAEEDD